MEKIVVCILSNDGRIAASLRAGILKAGLHVGKTLTDPTGLDKIITTELPSIVIIDTSLSSGADAISHAIATCDAASIPYLLLINEKRKYNLVIPEDTGLLGYLTIPILPETLTALLKTAIRRHQKWYELKQDIIRINRQSTASGIIWWEWNQSPRETEITHGKEELLTCQEISSGMSNNNKKQEFFGKTKNFSFQSISLEALFKRIHPDHLERVSKAAEMCIFGNTPDFSEFCSYRIGDTDVPMMITGTVTRYDGKKPTRLEGVMVPVPESSHEKIQDLCEISPDTFQLISDGTPYPFTIWEVMYDEEVGRPVDLLCLYCNQAFASLIKDNPVHLKGKSATSIFNTSVVPYLSRYAEVSWSLSPKTFQTLILPVEKWYEVSLFSPVRGIVAALSRDITEKVQKEEEEKKRSEILLAFHAPSYGTFVWDSEESSIHPDRQTVSFLGLSPDIRTLSKDSLIQLAHPDDQDRARTLVAMCTGSQVSTMSMSLRFRPNRNWVSYLVTIGPILKGGECTSGGLIAPQYPSDEQGGDSALSIRVLSGILSLLSTATTSADAGAACIPDLLLITGMEDGILLVRDYMSPLNIRYRTGTSTLADETVLHLGDALISHFSDETGFISDPVVFYSQSQLTELIEPEIIPQIRTVVLIPMAWDNSGGTCILLFSKAVLPSVKIEEILFIIHQISPAFCRILKSEHEKELFETLTYISCTVPDIPVVIEDNSVRFLSETLFSAKWMESHVQNPTDYGLTDDLKEELTKPLLDVAQFFINEKADKKMFGIGISLKNGEEKQYAVMFSTILDDDRQVIIGYIRDITRISRERTRLLSYISETHREEQEFLDLLSHTGNTTPPPYGFLLSPDDRVPAERLSTLAYVHNILYVHGIETEVGAETFLSGLSHMVLSWIPHPSRVLIALSAENSTIQRNHLIAVSLVVAELITFALRHAFTTNRSGTITISHSLEEDGIGEEEKEESICHLIIRDDGIPMPDGWDPDNSEESGVELVYYLVQVSLGGIITYNQTEGTCWDIRYPCVKSP